MILSMIDLVEEFKRGCRLVGGDVEEGKRVVGCILNDEEKIVIDKKGRWVKVYTIAYDGVMMDTKITVWDYLKGIAVFDDEFIIRTKNTNEPVYVRKVNRFGFEVPTVDSTPIFIHPDFVSKAWRKMIHIP